MNMIERGLQHICDCGCAYHFSEMDEYGYTTYFCSDCYVELVTFGPPGE